MAIQHFVTYARRIRELRQAHPDISEPALAPTFQRLIEDLLPTLLVPTGIEVVPEYQNAGVGRPDIALKRTGQPARAFIELKSLDKPAVPSRWRLAHDKRQYERLKTLKLWGGRISSSSACSNATTSWPPRRSCRAERLILRRRPPVRMRWSQATTSSPSLKP